ncbi:hypothetical protein F6X37_27170 [Paraburkholderia sp. 31.1]|nr:hypothetical protein [Paraburkholderia sp. 31.1]
MIIFTHRSHRSAPPSKFRKGRSGSRESDVHVARTALVKNRRKNGDHYWVCANVTPVIESGKTVGYLSVRTKPSRDEVKVEA